MSGTHRDLSQRGCRSGCDQMRHRDPWSHAHYTPIDGKRRRGARGAICREMGSRYTGKYLLVRRARSLSEGTGRTLDDTEGLAGGEQRPAYTEA